jgi:hypothetical protein
LRLILRVWSVPEAQESHGSKFTKKSGDLQE